MADRGAGTPCGGAGTADRGAGSPCRDAGTADRGAGSPCRGKYGLQNTLEAFLFVKAPLVLHFTVNIPKQIVLIIKITFQFRLSANSAPPREKGILLEISRDARYPPRDTVPRLMRCSELFNLLLAGSFEILISGDQDTCG